MDYNDLLEKYNLLLGENARLKEENERLKALLGQCSSNSAPNHAVKEKAEIDIHETESTDGASLSEVTKNSDSLAKIQLFMSFFKGRRDVYAKWWQNKSKSKFGYSPVCVNQWQPGLCAKPKAPCSKCDNKVYAPLEESVIEEHLRGNIVAGIYPMLPDETCHFLAMDFDEADWQNDIAVLRQVCHAFHIPMAVERSRSGHGGHAWFFFESRLSAALARKFGTALLTAAMNKRHEIHFKSYDRFFPSQDTMPKGGLGNLIALPLQKAARQSRNSEFVNERFESYPDQWAFLSTIERLPEDRIEALISELSPGHELGVLKIDDEADEDAPQRPWETRNIKKDGLRKTDFPKTIDIVEANMLFIPKAGISQRALNRLKRLASFKNPMFYKQQAMRLPTYGHPRVISCAGETGPYLCLPRGCANDLSKELNSIGIGHDFIDKTNHGRKIDVTFNGRLRDDQAKALEQLRAHNTGILSGTTAFGKTIVAIQLIAERKVNTLILVDKVTLLSQWKEKLMDFLHINEPVPEPECTAENKRGRKKKFDVIGQLGAGKDRLSGIVDIAVMQSLSRQGEVKDCVKNYGMIIADECHHASAFTYEQILKAANARYIYGLTATPTRKDGHHPILFMHCGPIRYRDNAKQQAAARPFDHYIVPRFTGFRVPVDRDEQEVSIQELYAEIVDNAPRNEQIIEDVRHNYESGRNCIVLSLRTAHVEWLLAELRKTIPDVIMLTGGMGKRTTREAFRRIADMPADKNFVLVATGHFIGEGFDEPRLDTLFLAMPISWKGTLQQYAGRLHRLAADK
ncbi:MAG: TOTE conflict system archaeo-eukaryotic primase domain-containing protein, partial [Thermodesulfobacteriota bacterium]